MPPVGGLPTRRRSSSSGTAESPSRTSTRNNNASGSTDASGQNNGTSTRSRRRGRGMSLPTSSKGATNGSPTPIKKEPTPSSVPSTPTTTPNMRSPRASRNALLKKSGLMAVTGDRKSIQVTVKLGGKVVSSEDWLEAPAMGTSTPTTRKRTRSSSISIEETSQEETMHDTQIPASTPSSTATAEEKGMALPLGTDGNTFYCKICGDPGNVVCCDGCPDVYHGQCVPAGESRLSLENDVDPWYCPTCFAKRKTEDKDDEDSTSKEAEATPKSDQSSKSNRFSPKVPSPFLGKKEGRADEQEKEGNGDLPMVSDAADGSTPETPVVKRRTRNNSRVEEDDAMSSKSESNNEDDLSSKDASNDNDETGKEGEESAIDEPMDVEESSTGPVEADQDKTLRTRPKRRTREPNRSHFEEEAEEDDDESDPMDGDEDLEEEPLVSSADSPGSSTQSPSPKKRSRLSLPSSKTKANAEAASPVPSSATKKKNKDGKKKKRKDSDDRSSSPVPGRPNDDEDFGSVHPFGNSGSDSFQAIPAFFFFLNENRHKIERNLSRRHRIFNRLPKGYERNELVAKEGAVWWSKLRDSEVRRFMTMSMRDFEQRIIEWKEEKNLRDMLAEDGYRDGDETMDASWEDEKLTYENHQRLYLGTNVGCKPFKPEPGISHNRVLLELLQDIRFHPMPMFMSKRPEVEYGQMDFDRITIPYFDVHGPFSTSVGDECLGCTRGWTHFCPVLKRRVPAVEHRAKLQPPLSSLVATRIGLGLRPRNVDKGDDNCSPLSDKDKQRAELFSTREVPEYVEAQNLPPLPCDSLADSSSRADDIVQFIEETVSMKVPEPPRPVVPGRLHKGSDSIFDADEPTTFNKCGRCRTVIQNDTGCIQCRRAQLVINMSKRPPSDEQKGKGDKRDVSPQPNVKNNLKVQAVMCGRVNMKEGCGEMQNDGDIAIANGILRQRWTPFSILPSDTLRAPTPKSKHTSRFRHVQLTLRSNSERESEVDEDSVKSELDERSKTSRSGMEPDLRRREGGRTDGEIVIQSKESKDGSGQSDDNSSVEPSTAGSRSKRLRSARIAGSIGLSQSDDDEERQRSASRYKEEADRLQAKCLEISCCGILLALMRRDPLLLFAAPVTAEGYSTIIKDPIHFGKIRANVLDGKYGSLGSFISDCRLLCTNALTYNPPGSIYWKTAKELHDILVVMQKRASRWTGAIKDAHAFAFRRSTSRRAQRDTSTSTEDDSGRVSPSPSVEDIITEDPFSTLRESWPEAVEMLEDHDWLKRAIAADFMRTRENETAYYGALAVRRTAVAAEAVLAPYPDSCGTYNPVAKRSYKEDEALQRAISDRVAKITDPVELKDLPTWREESIVRVMRRAQTRRLDGMFGSQNGCARCDGSPSEIAGIQKAKLSQPVHLGRNRRKNNEVSRIHASRMNLSTGMASKTTRERIQGLLGDLYNQKDLNEKAKAANEVSVTVRGSSVHGWGLFADQYFKPGDVVAEYIGEYVSLAVTEAREKMYQEQRIQDYQFRVDDHLVIDATMRGGHGRYINHNCNPNCVAKVIPGTPPNENLKRVIIIAQRKIQPREELTYDYQFPLELDLSARIPCNCQSDQCRGFMNWDLPEKGSNNRVFRSQKRGANMRDRIRRLGRPLKSDKGDDDDDDDDNEDDNDDFV